MIRITFIHPRGETLYERRAGVRCLYTLWQCFGPVKWSQNIQSRSNRLKHCTEVFRICSLFVEVLSHPGSRMGLKWVKNLLCSTCGPLQQRGWLLIPAQAFPWWTTLTLIPGLSLGVRHLVKPLPHLTDQCTLGLTKSWMRDQMCFPTMSRCLLLFEPLACFYLFIHFL